MRLNLPEITLSSVCWGGNSFLYDLVWAYTQFNRKTRFAEKIFFIGDEIDYAAYGNFFVSEGIQVISLKRGYDKRQYSHLMIKELNNFISTDFVMTFQFDGFIANINAWDESFLKYDYIGAPWWFEDGNNVGNGGFSIRSKRLLEVLAKDDHIQRSDPEDHAICRVYGDYLCEEHGIVFAPEKIAARFAVEGPPWDPGKYVGQFGFHSWRQLRAYLDRRKREAYMNSFIPAL